MYAVISYLGCFMGPPRSPLTRQVMAFCTDISNANGILQDLEKSGEHPNTHLAVVRIKKENEKIIFFFDEQSW